MFAECIDMKSDTFDFIFSVLNENKQTDNSMINKSSKLSHVEKLMPKFNELNELLNMS